ncbi:Ca2+-dependent phosphoinositide-specific phospholipase C [Asticcacaulis sp. 201]|uniref:Ca2+-dependent phosphoinositide-specific phospholipase C n=1 Tax=Asticcacaulis sp. 201 TaxID=3028787 RepID=UPI002916735E|nr:Ca2+-dependent phosphoinositide-specific phospholipase C [Asticcacaulis sp. 201]MDV6331178.1 Ca2+-dependent phosphoinositide-specific phospholipase C [Asticcacaulis sp. 201]
MQNNIFLSGLTVLTFLTAPTAFAANGPKLNEIQILGSHNSYRPVPDTATQANLDSLPNHAGQGLEYGHPDITTQLNLGVRQLEFDPYADTTGGLYAGPYDKTAPDYATMAAPGLKVLHIPTLDYRSHCITLRACLTQVADWAKAHPDHDTIILFINTKEEPVNDPRVTKPALYSEADLAEVDADARDILGADKLITPDTIRGHYKTLRDGVMAGNWPLAADAKGKFMLVLDSNPRIADLYRQGHPSLAGRVMFGLYAETDAEAAVFNIQDPRPEAAHITQLVKQGFFVRSRADANTSEARTHDLKRFDAAVNAGAQAISTDYYEGAPDPYGFKFVVRMKQGFKQTNPLFQK